MADMLLWKRHEMKHENPKGWSITPPKRVDKPSSSSVRVQTSPARKSNEQVRQGLGVVHAGRRKAPVAHVIASC